MAGSNKRYRKICERMQYVPENEEQNRSANREVEAK